MGVYCQNIPTSLSLSLSPSSPLSFPLSLSHAPLPHAPLLRAPSPHAPVGASKQCQVFDVNTGAELVNQKCGDRVRSACFGKSGDIVVSLKIGERVGMGSYEFGRVWKSSD